MSGIFKVVLIAGLAVGGFTSLAMAEPGAPRLEATALAASKAGPVGVVVDVQGQPASIGVLRGNRIYGLKKGDPLFANDHVFTRVSSTAVLVFHDCRVALDTASTVIVEPKCDSTPANLLTGQAGPTGGGGAMQARGSVRGQLVRNLAGLGGAAAAGTGAYKKNSQSPS